MAIRLDLAFRVGTARGFIEVDAVDDVAAVARQLLAVALLHRRRAGLGELTGDTADFHYRQGSGVGEHHRHLQKDAQEVADIVGADVVGAGLGERFGAIASLQQKALASGDPAERLFQAARLAGKNERRECRKAPLDGGERLLVGIFGDLHNRLLPPTVARPTLGHDRPPLRSSPPTGEIFQLSASLYTRPGSPSQIELDGRSPPRGAGPPLFCRLAAITQRLLP